MIQFQQPADQAGLVDPTIQQIALAMVELQSNERPCTPEAIRHLARCTRQELREHFEAAADLATLIERAG